MWEYKIRESLGLVDRGGEYGFPSMRAAKAAFRRAHPHTWQAWACTIYAPGYKPAAEKEAGAARFKPSSRR